jgi:glycosyltransferase involved in cell wall biosynthesis
MRLAFINFTGLTFDPDTPYQKPLGGSESGICYLSVELAKLGHEVILFTKLPKKKIIRGVTCIPMDTALEPDFKNFDIMIVQNSPYQGYQIKPLLSKKTKLVLWSGHAHDQLAVETLAKPEVRLAYDAITVVSNWLRDDYAQAFNIPKIKMTVLKNAIAPAFEDLFKSKADLAKAKAHSPIISYTSTPFRGLNLLLAIFPSIHRAMPEVTLQVFGSLKPYQATKKEDQKLHGDLYRLCQTTKGVDYLDSVPQPVLAQKMRQVTALTYTNTFIETSCISVMEAMAAGCQIITSNLGGLPETMAGFGLTLPITGDWDEYCRQFAKQTYLYLVDFSGKGRGKLLDRLHDQVKYINDNYTWKVRAREWEKWLTTLLNQTK